MKILHVIAQKPQDTGSGVYARNLISFLDKKGLKQSIICGIDREDRLDGFPCDLDFNPVIFNEGDMDFSVVGMSDVMPYKSTRYKDLKDSKLNIWKKSFTDKLEEVKKEFKPDIVVTHHLYLLSSIVRDTFPHTPVIGVCHATDIRQLKSHDLEREYILDTISKLDRVLALNPIQNQEIQDFFNIDKDKVETMGLAYNDKIFYRDETIKNEKRNIWYVGKVAKSKGVEELIHAISDIPNISLNIAGGVNSEEGIFLLDTGKELVEEITFHGLVEQDFLAKNLRKGELLVLPSYYEGFPMVVIEALACGMKVVVNDLPGLREGLGSISHSPFINFVPMPNLISTDSIDPNDRTKYIETLKKSIENSLDKTPLREVSLDDFTWNSLGNRFLNSMRNVYKSNIRW